MQQDIGTLLLLSSILLVSQPLHSQETPLNCCLSDGTCQTTSESICLDLMATELSNTTQQQREIAATLRTSNQQFKPSYHLKSTLKGSIGSLDVEVISCVDFPADQAPVTRANKLRNHPWFKCEIQTSCGDVFTSLWPKYSDGHLAGSKTHSDPSSISGENLFRILIKTPENTVSVSSAEKITTAELEFSSCE